MARKMTGWQGPLMTRRFAEPSGPLQDIAACLVHDYTNQRTLLPSRIGSNSAPSRAMNASGRAAQADVSSLDTNGTGSPFIAPFIK